LIAFAVNLSIYWIIGNTSASFMVKSGVVVANELIGLVILPLPPLSAVFSQALDWP
jgi:hypothetical protein